MDRISSLPTDVIYHILNLMPAQDAGRTSILSSKWRYMWADNPTLILDERFWYSMEEKILSKGLTCDYAVHTINRMFLHHLGHIHKCVLDLSCLRSDLSRLGYERHKDVNLWLSILSRRGVKVLLLKNSHETPYMVPSCVFSNSHLVKLSICKGYFVTTKPSLTLNKLESLTLENIFLTPLVLVTPLLSTLTLKSCRGVHDFIIHAPRLVSLKLVDNDDLNLVPYLLCSSIEYAYISLNKKLEHEGDSQSTDMMKLLGCWPKISNFVVDKLSLKYLTTGVVPMEFPVIFNLRLLAFVINFNVNQIAWVLRLLQNSPVLRRFEIVLYGDVTNELEVVNYLQELNIMNQKMEELRIVKMKCFSASRVELLFTEILLRCAPSLERMLVEEKQNLDPVDCLRVSKELMRLPRASPVAEIIFGPNFVPT